MIKRWLRNKLNEPVRRDIEQQIWALNKSLMQPNPEYPHGHPHTSGLVDGLRRALDAMDTEYK